MAVCLGYQAVYVRRRAEGGASIRAQLGAALLLLAALSFKIWIRIESTDVGYDLSRERSRTVALDMERRELELQRSVLLRTDTLTRRAKEKAGLGALQPAQARKISVSN